VDHNNVRVDIGCGPNKKSKDNEKWIGLDSHDYSHKYPKDEFIQWDLETGCLPFCSSSVLAINARAILEHISNFIPLMNDCWRVLEPEGSIYILVPQAGQECSFRDPTHVRYFTLRTFDYFESKQRQENYDMKPWRIITKRIWPRFKNHIECVLKPDKK